MMLKTLHAIALCLALSIAASACGEVTDSPDSGVADAAQADSGCVPLGTLAFGEACAEDCDCVTQVCFQFGSVGLACSQTCDGDGDCPSGSQGQKCNGQGYCAP